MLAFYNTDRLVGHSDWDIELQKTGFTNAAGRCLVLLLHAERRSLIMVFLDGNGKLTRYADAHRVIKQLALLEKQTAAAAPKSN
jgi:D-alanyl-D-alanine endopeptidase (penicillin-binding protein 7)